MKLELPENRYVEPEEISIIDIWNILASQKKWVLGVPLALVLGSAVAVFLMKPQWEATAVVQVGQIWQGQGAQPMPVEPPLRAVERLKLKPFQMAILTKLGIALDEADPLRKLYTDNLKTKVILNTDLIELKLRAFSREEARRWAETTVEHLKSAHEQLSEPSIARLKQYLAEMKRQLQVVQEERQELLKNAQLKSEIGPANRFAESLLLSNFLLQKNAELRDFELRKIALEEQLNPAKTFPTSLIDKVYVPEKPASPKKTLIIALAGVLGLFAGLFIAFVMHSIQTQKASPVQVSRENERLVSG